MNFHLDDSKVQKWTDERIKVAMLGAFSSHLGIGSGSATYTNRLAKYLAHRENIELHVVTFGDKDVCYECENAYFERDSFAVHAIEKPFGYPLSLPLLISRLRRKIMETNPDIVHSLGSSVPYSTPAALIHHKYPTVLTMFGIIAREYKLRPSRINVIESFLVSKPNERYVLSRIPNIIVETESIKRLVGTMTNSVINVIPNGIQFEEIQKIQPPGLNGKPDIFLVQELTKVKGVDILIRCIPTITKFVPDLEVYIGGSGPQENALRSLARDLNLERNVRFLGSISEEDKFRYHKACKIVVIPSRWDCQPTTLLEAMAAGKAVIASNVGGIPDTVDDGETGFLFERGNIEDLASKIVTLLEDDELREKMGGMAREKAKEYDWNKIAERTVKVYREAIAGFHERKAE